VTLPGTDLNPPGDVPAAAKPATVISADVATGSTPAHAPSGPHAIRASQALQGLPPGHGQPTSGRVSGKLSPGAAASHIPGVVPIVRHTYFKALDQDPAFRDQATKDAIGGLLDLLGRSDVPPALDRAYTAKAGSKGGGRILMALDYTRGIGSTETFWQAAKQGPGHLIATKAISPRLSHFRTLEGKSLFAGDDRMPTAFRDSPLWGPQTNQVGHLLCAVEAGARMGQLSQHPLGSQLYDAGLKVATKALGFKNVESNAADVTRAGVIGHEMRGDDDGFTGQMSAYDALVANGDPYHARAEWDQAVAAALAGDHEQAWVHIRALGAAIEAPSTTAEVAQNLANDQPRFAPAHQKREGNSVQDIALSVYGYAVGYAAVTKGLATPADAQARFEALFTAAGHDAAAINHAAGER
jgi:hypothetical protein